VIHLLVDGYNVIAVDPALSKVWRRNPDEACARLVEAVGAYAVGTYRATVVFDASDNPYSDGKPHHVAGVAVIFSKAGEDADSVIEAIAHRVSVRGGRVRVVTSDANIQWTVMKPGVTRMSSPELLREMRDVGRDWEEHTPSGVSRSRLEERVDLDTREALWRWARGRSDASDTDLTHV